MQRKYHKPVMCEELLGFIGEAPNGIILDATLGDGGHSIAVLESFPGKAVIGLDRDNSAIERASKRLGGKYGDRFRAVEGNFSDIKTALESAGIKENLAGAIFDFGFSSTQIGDPERGMSFSLKGPLDMRMGPDAEITLEKLIEKLSKEELGKIIKKYGEEKFAAKISREVKKAFVNGLLKDTVELGEVIAGAIPKRLSAASKLHPATRTFQAFRIEVNRELEHIESALDGLTDLLAPGAIAVFISYHSLEDRLVKRAANKYARPCTCPNNIPECVCGLEPTAIVLTSRPVRSGREEVEINPRARSAKLRAIRKI